MPPTGPQPYDYTFVNLLRMAPFELRKNGWRFGTKRIGDTVVNRLIAAGIAVREGSMVMLQAHGPLDGNPLEAIPDTIAAESIGVVVISTPLAFEPAIDAALVLLDHSPMVPA
jgi:hypothetical protein